jgi:RND family efflux transporter MFP subunit
MSFMNNPAAKKGIAAAGALVVLVLLLLYLMGTFGAKTPPGNVPIEGDKFPGAKTAAVVRTEVEDVQAWPGTVRSRTSAQVASKLMARILEVKVKTGAEVKAGDVIAVLDDRDVKARAQQAGAALTAAQAQRAKAEAEFARIKGLFAKDAATQRDFEAAEAAAKSARAGVLQAENAVKEAEAFLSETTVRAPFDGIVAEKLAEPGDTAVPGKPLAIVHDPTRLRLEAQVPESCVRKASVGMEVKTRFDALDSEVTAVIEEISPVADPQSRTFLIKAALPQNKDLRPGTFGRFIQSCKKRTILLIPAKAVSRTGQLETVRVLEEGEARPRHVRTGKTYEARVEILSGLREGEKVIVDKE